MYDGYVGRLSRRALARLDYIEAVYNFTLGDEYEIAVCSLLSEVLPARFGVCRGFVISEDGHVAGDDVIIFDRLKYPTLRSLSPGDFSLKEKVPIEAVYAYLECKHTLTEDNLPKALDQVKAVKSLLLGRRQLMYADYEEDGPKYLGKIRDWPRNYPKRKNQPFAGIVSRHVDFELHRIEVTDEFGPDLIIAGADIIATQRDMLGSDGIKGALFADHRNSARICPDLIKGEAFGLGIILLLQALDWIELLPINWTKAANQTYFDHL